MTLPLDELINNFAALAFHRVNGDLCTSPHRVQDAMRKLIDAYQTRVIEGGYQPRIWQDRMARQ
jgi:hypothetical protein